MKLGLTQKTREAAGRFLVPGSFSRNVLTTLITQAVMLVLSVGSSAITARLLGAEGKGLVAMTTLVQGLMVLIFNLGIGVSNVQFAGSRRQGVPSLTANSMGFALAMAAIGIPLFAGAGALGWLGRLIPRLPLPYLLFGIAGFPVVLLGVYFACILQGIQRIPQTNVANLVQGVSSLLLMVVLVLGLRWGVWGALLAILVASAVGTILKGLYLRREGARLRPSWDGPAIRRMLSFGLRGHVGNLLQFFNYRLDVFVLNFYLGPAAVGIYSVGVSLAELLWQLPQAASYVIFPKAASISAAKMNRFTPRVLLVTMGGTLAGAVGLAILGPWLIRLVFSSRFSASYAPMVALLPGVVLLGGGKVLTNDIAGRGHPEYNSLTSGVVALMTIGLTLWLIPRYGLMGAAIASSIAYGTAFLASLVIYRRVSRKTGSAERNVHLSGEPESAIAGTNTP